MARKAPSHLVVGQVRKPHGIQGEVFVLPLTDHPESVFAPGVVLLEADAGGRAPDPSAPPLRVDEVRPFRRGFLVLFGGMRDRNDAERLRDLYLMLSTEDLEPLADDEIFYHELLGMKVQTVAGEEVGDVREVYEVRPSDLLEVRTRRGSVLIPFTREVVVEVDRAAGRLVVDPPEGLLDL